MNTVSILTPIVTSLAGLVSAFLFDRALEATRRVGAQTLQISPHLWGGILIDGAFMAIPIFLSTAYATLRPAQARDVASGHAAPGNSLERTQPGRDFVSQVDRLPR